MANLPKQVESHYTLAGLEERILEALRQAGQDPESLKWEDLSPLDEFHVRGRGATAELARLAGVDDSMHIIDIGCGVGGPARFLAGEFGCRVTGVDVTAAFCRAATMLAERTGMSEKVEFRQGDAVELPFEESSFDLVWMQHMTMNIKDKPALIREIQRVLKPGHKVAFHEPMSGGAGVLRYPVPWARDDRVSFLIPPDQLRNSLEQGGFEIVVWEDVTDEAHSWFERVVNRLRKHGPPVLGLHLLLGPDMTIMSSNMLRNIEEGRLRLVRGVLKSPPVSDAP